MYLAGRPAKNLEPYQESLVHLFQEGGATYEHLKLWLEQEKDVVVSIRTLKNWMRKWEISKRMPVEVEEAVKAKIQFLFFEYGLKDDEILRILQKDGYSIGKWTLSRLRLELGLRRRAHTAEMQAEAEAILRGSA